MIGPGFTDHLPIGGLLVGFIIIALVAGTVGVAIGALVTYAVVASG